MPLTWHYGTYNYNSCAMHESRYEDGCRECEVTKAIYGVTKDGKFKKVHSE